MCVCTGLVGRLFSFMFLNVHMAQSLERRSDVWYRRYGVWCE